MEFRNTSRAVACLATCFFIEAAASSAMLPFVVIWANRNLGLTGPSAGVLFVGQAVGEFAAGVVAGGLADRFGHRRVLLISTTGMALGYGLLAPTSVPVLAITLFVLAGVFESAFHPTVLALVGDVTTEERLTHAFSVVRIGSNAGRIVGPLIGALVALTALPAVFLASGVLLAACVVLQVALLPRDTARDRRGEVEADLPRGVLGALRHDRVLALLVLGGALLATTFAWWEADGLVLLRAQTELSTTAYAALFTVAAVTVVVGQLPATRAVAHLPAGRVLLTGASLQGLGLALLIAARAGYAVLVVAVVLMAVGEMIYGPMVSTLATRRARPDQRASYQAALSITQDIGTAVGPISGLALARVTTSAGLWATGAVLSTVAGIANWLAAARAGAAARVGPVGPADGRG